MTRPFFDECERLVNSDRQADYGDPCSNLLRFAGVASTILNIQLSAKDIALIFVAVKLCREGANHKRDNLLDMACYAELIDRLEEGK
jgi:hypothetical protein